MMTIRRRLLLLLLPGLALLMSVGGLVDYWIAVATTRNAYDRSLASTAFAAAAYLRAQDGHVVFAPTERAASLFAPDPGDTRSVTLFAISGPAGELLAGSAALATLVQPIAPIVRQPLYRDVVLQGASLRTASIAVPTAAGPAQITVAESRERRSRAQRVVLLGKLLVDFAELDLTLVLVWIAVYYGLRPLETLRDQVEAHAPRELRGFDEARVPGELRAVVVAFNRVLALLNDAAQVQQRFVADAAHQLRTPVAGLLAQIELLLQEPRAAPVQRELSTLHRAITHLAHSANQLLSLARAEPVAGARDSFQPVELRTLVEALVERHLGRADAAGIDLGADAQPASVPGNAWLLEDLLGNLIDNALKYTPRGGRVTVRSGIIEGAPCLEVEDDGPGIPEAERQRVRERFYRRPGAPGMGIGLGLAIVDEIARLHRAAFSIGAADAAGQGARMRVRFPPVT